MEQTRDNNIYPHTKVINVEREECMLSARMKLTVKVGVTNGLGFNIPFPITTATFSNITVNWGDGSTSVVVTDTLLTAGDSFEHTYPAAGIYTITLTSSQTDKTMQQIPPFDFKSNRKENNNPVKLISMDTPMLNTGQVDFNFCFYNCISLVYVSAGLFSTNTQVTSFRGCFYGCKGLTSVPADLFATNTQVTDFFGCFFSCSSLSSLPAGLFVANTLVEDFSLCFFSCNSLFSVPAGLFATNTLVTDFNSCFDSCINLVLNETIFSSPENTDQFSGKTMNFSYCFWNVGVNLTDEQKETSIAPELWTYNKEAAIWTTTTCYTNCNASNIVASKIPTAWGGSTGNEDQHQ